MERNKINFLFPEVDRRFSEIAKLSVTPFGTDVDNLNPATQTVAAESGRVRGRSMLWSDESIDFKVTRGWVIVKGVEVANANTGEVIFTQFYEPSINFARGDTMHMFGISFTVSYS